MIFLDRKRFSQIIAVLVVLGIIIFPLQSFAVFPYFGGTVIWSFFCTCSGNYVVAVGPPVPGLFSYYIATQGFPSYNLPRPGAWALGEYSPAPQTCLMYAGITCIPVMVTQGLITSVVGTSP